MSDFKLKGGYESLRCGFRNPNNEQRIFYITQGGF